MGRWILTGGVAVGGVLAALTVAAFGSDVDPFVGHAGDATAGERVALQRAVDDCYESTTHVALRACLTAAMDQHLQSMRVDSAQAPRPMLLSRDGRAPAAVRTDL